MHHPVLRMCQLILDISQQVLVYNFNFLFNQLLSTTTALLQICKPDIYVLICLNKLD